MAWKGKTYPLVSMQMSKVSCDLLSKSKLRIELNFEFRYKCEIYFWQHFSDRSVWCWPILITAKDKCLQQRSKVGWKVSRPMISSINALKSRPKLQALIDQKLSISVKLLICDYIQLIVCIAILRDFEEIEAFLRLDKWCGGILTWYWGIVGIPQSLFICFDCI